MNQAAQIKQDEIHSLSPCSKKSNCVSSLDTERRRFVEPLPFSGSAKAAKTGLLKVLASMKGAQVIKTDEHYIHAEFVSPVFKFVDDVEFLIDEVSHTIQLKSSSRVVFYDFGANRKRIKLIREHFLNY